VPHCQDYVWSIGENPLAMPMECATPAMAGAEVVLIFGLGEEIFLAYPFACATLRQKIACPP